MANSILGIVAQFKEDRRGVTALEYALLAVLISMPALTWIRILGSEIALPLLIVAAAIGNIPY
jgi:Flp pilus assembly pilin Flp